MLHPCIAKANVGDEIEIHFQTTIRYNTKPYIERAAVVGLYKLISYKDSMTCPVVALPESTNIPCYYPGDVINLRRADNSGFYKFPGFYCLPLHEDFISHDSIKKIFKKKK